MITQTQQAYIGLGVAAVVILFIWFMISLKVKREVKKYAKENIRNPGEPVGGSIGEPPVGVREPAPEVQGIGQQRSGIPDVPVDDIEQLSDGDSGSPEGEQQASEPSSETATLPDGADRIPEPADFEEI